MQMSAYQQINNFFSSPAPNQLMTGNAHGESLQLNVLSPTLLNENATDDWARLKDDFRNLAAAQDDYGGGSLSEVNTEGVSVFQERRAEGAKSRSPPRQHQIFKNLRINAGNPGAATLKEGQLSATKQSPKWSKISSIVGRAKAPEPGHARKPSAKTHSSRTSLERKKQLLQRTVDNSTNTSACCNQGSAANYASLASKHAAKSLGKKQGAMTANYSESNLFLKSGAGNPSKSRTKQIQISINKSCNISRKNSVEKMSAAKLNSKQNASRIENSEPQPTQHFYSTQKVGASAASLAAYSTSGSAAYRSQDLGSELRSIASEQLNLQQHPQASSYLGYSACGYKQSVLNASGNLLSGSKSQLFEQHSKLEKENHSKKPTKEKEPKEKEPKEKPFKPKLENKFAALYQELKSLNKKYSQKTLKMV